MFALVGLKLVMYHRPLAVLMPRDRLEIAFEHHRAGRLRQAEAEYRALLEEQPGHPDAAHWLGVLTYQAGRPDEATPLFEQAASARPLDAAFQYNLGQAYLACARFNEAIQSFERAEAIDPRRAEIPMAGGLARLARKAPGDAEAAVALFERARSAGLDSPELHQHRGVALLMAGRPAEAIAACRTALQKKPDFAEAYHALALAHRLEGDVPGARQWLQTALEVDPASAKACHDLGVLEAETGRFQEAEALFRRAIELRPDYASAHQGLGAVLRHTGRHSEATLASVQAVRASRRAAGQSVAPLSASSAIGELEQRLAPSAEAANLHFRLALMLNLPPPPQVPAPALTDLFDRYAERFDEHLRGKLAYRVPELLAEAVAATHPTRPLDTLDLGCGTGLCGMLLRPMAGLLCGVDLSPAMIEKSRARGVYDRLEVAEIIDAMRRAPGSFDLIVAADVFIYVGDLVPAFEAAVTALRPGGLLAFSVEAGEGDRFQLHSTTRRFNHSKPYLQRLARMYGLAEESFTPITVRVEAGQPAAGYLVVLRAPRE